MKNSTFYIFVIVVVLGLVGIFIFEKTTYRLTTDEMFDAILADKHETVFKMPVPPRVGFGWGREYNRVNTHYYNRDGIGMTKPFFKSMERYLALFLPQFANATGINVELVLPAEEVLSGRDDVNIRIVVDGSFTREVEGKKIYSGDLNAIIEDDPLYHGDVVRLKMTSPMRAYAYFDDSYQIKRVVCHMWIYMNLAETQTAMHECIVRAFGVLGGLDKLSYFQSPVVHRDVRKLIKFLYCPEVKSGMGRSDLQEIVRQNKCP